MLLSDNKKGECALLFVNRGRIHHEFGSFMRLATRYSPSFTWWANGNVASVAAWT